MASRSVLASQSHFSAALFSDAGQVGGDGLGHTREVVRLFLDLGGADAARADLGRLGLA
jgi:hypothetical protein